MPEFNVVIARDRVQTTDIYVEAKDATEAVAKALHEVRHKPDFVSWSFEDVPGDAYVVEATLEDPGPGEEEDNG